MTERVSRTVATAPVRADLAGGTLDLWPLGLFHPGSATVAVALGLRVEAEVSRGPGPGRATVASRDLGVEEKFETADAGAGGGRLALLRRLVLTLAPAGARLTTFSPLPAGSGLGTSSALGVAAAAALLRAQARRVARDEVIRVVRDCEAQVLGIPTGTQDHQAAWRGGIVVLRQQPGGAVVRRLAGPLLSELSARLIVVDSGAARSSGPSNWDMFRRRIDGDRDAVRALGRVAGAGARAADALDARDWKGLGRAMCDDLDARRAWSPLVVTEPLEAIFEAARSARALGYKVCGAGGGGFAVVLADPARRDAVGRAVRAAGGRPADAPPVARGLSIAVRD